jgi:hypothetical protein
MPKKMVLALSTVFIFLTMAFSAAALAHDPPRETDHGAHSRGHSEERPTSGEQQASHSDEGPSLWLPVAFTLSGVVVLGGLVVVLRRS